jgi:hypothetical protein
MPPEDVYIDFECPSCKTSLSVPEELAGVEGPCPVCDATVTAPHPEEAEEPAIPEKEPEPEPQPPVAAAVIPETVGFLTEEAPAVPLYQKPGFRWARIGFTLISLAALGLIALELKNRGVFERAVDPPEKLPRGVEPQIGPGTPSAKPADYEKRVADELLKE